MISLFYHHCNASETTLSACKRYFSLQNLHRVKPKMKPETSCFRCEHMKTSQTAA